jgi:hypothetical protein
VSLPPLVSVSDVTARLPSSVTVEAVRVLALIADASAVVRSFTKQQFTTSQTTDRIRPVGFRVVLPQRPVVSVDSVAVLLNNETPTPFPGWYWDGSQELWLLGESQIINLAEELALGLRYQTPIVLVTYTHGYATTPDDVVAVVCSMVTRTLTAPGLGGVVSESVGEYSYRLSDTAAQGALTMTDSEKKALDSYRRKVNVVESRW